MLRLETSREVAIVIVGIDDTDFEELTSPEEGHRAAAFARLVNNPVSRGDSDAVSPNFSTKPLGSEFAAVVAQRKET